MTGGFPLEISLDNLGKLQKLYSHDWPKHIAIFSTFKLLAKRVEKRPELKESFKLFALSEGWMTDGAVFLIFTAADGKKNIFFDSLDDSPSAKLKAALLGLDYSYMCLYFSVRDVFQALTEDIVNEKGLAPTHDPGTICHYLPKNSAKSFEISLPENFTLKPMSDVHVDKVNSAWPHRFEGSEKFMLYSIQNHLNLGLFNENDELIAWSLMYDNGALGAVQVDENHLRKGYGSLVTKAMSKKIAGEYDLDVIGFIVATNENSLKMFAKLGFKSTTRHKWFVMIKI